MEDSTEKLWEYFNSLPNGKKLSFTLKQEIVNFVSNNFSHEPVERRAIGENEQAEEGKSDCCNAPVETGFMYDRCTKCNQYIID